MFRDPAEKALLRSAQVVAVAAVVATVIVLTIRVITHHLFFDETLHLRYLWRISVGDRPYRDFFCQYPVTGYIPVLPLFRLLPESAFVVLVLRVLSVGVTLGTTALLGWHGRRVAGSWIFGALPFLTVASTPEIGNFAVEYGIDGLAMIAAVGAAVAFTSAPSARRVALAAGLCVLSVLVMPKYAPMLFLGGVGYLVVAGRGVGWRPALLGGLTGATGAGAAVWGLLASQGISLGDMLSMLAFQSRWTIQRSDYPQTIAEVGAHWLGRHWPIALIFALGLAGWIVGGRRDLLRRQLPLLGVLVATLLYAVRVKSPFEQMLMPVLVVLAFFAPYAVALLREPPDLVGAARAPVRRRWAELGLAAAAVVAAAVGFADARTGFIGACGGRDCSSPYVQWPQMKPGFDTLKEIDELLKLVPQGEPVVAMWYRHPLFRRDLTWMTFDEQDSYTRGMSPGDPMLGRFDPRSFRAALEARPPAYVSLLMLDRNYPPGWIDVLLEFLRERASSYTRHVEQDGDVTFVRNDLVRR